MRRLLYILHCFHNRAGTEEHTKTLANGLGQEFETAILYPENGALHLRTMADGMVQTFPAAPVPFPVTPYRVRAVSAALHEAIRAFRPDLIHIQHFIYWPLSLVAEIADLQVPSAISFHDYYALSPNFTLLGARSADDAFDPDYVRRVFGADITDYLRERRDILQRDLSRISRRVSPSQFLADFLRGALTLDTEVIPHGIPPFELRSRRESTGTAFGCVGSLLPQKGWRALHAAFERLLECGVDAELHFYGGGEATPPSRERIFFHGTYDQQDLPRICEEFDIAVIPSVFRETFSLVLSEMWQAKKPVCASRIGALAERIQDGVNGRLFEPGNVDSIAETLQSVLESNDWRRWTTPPVRSLQEMLVDYSRLYNEMNLK